MRHASRFRNFLIGAALGIGALTGASGRAEADAYIQTNLVSDGLVPAAVIDPMLVNPWGVSHSSTSPFWISNQGTRTSVLYNVSTTPPSKVPIAPNGFVAIPPAAAGGPTGQVNNGNASSFLLTNGDGGSARFIFANLNGAISGWDGGATSVIQATTTGAVYTGLAINTAMDYLYAANSAGTGSIDVFDSTFTRATLPGAFANPFPGLVPFNVQNVGGKIYVTYALPGLAAMRSATEGNGGVAVFDDNGVLLQTLITDSKLASPWGIAQAPSTGFGPFSGDLLVGNFSFVASEINAFDPVTGAFEGTIPIDDGGQHGGLWALNFGIGGQNGNPNTLFFTDGIGGEMHGLFAAITFVPEPSSLALLGVAFAFFGVRRTRARG